MPIRTVFASTLVAAAPIYSGYVTELANNLQSAIAINNIRAT